MTKQYRLVIVNLFLILLFLFWNFNQPLVADDFGRAITDIFQNHNLIHQLQYDYLTWTGRITAQIIAYIFFRQSYDYLLIPVLNVINAIVFLLILYKIYFFINRKPANWLTFYILTFSYIAYFTMIGTFPHDFLWKTVVVQYAWGYLLLLSIVKKFYLDWINNRQASFREIFLYVIAAIFLGFYNEIFIAFLFSVYLCAIVTALLFKYPLKSLLKRQYIIFLGILLITALLSIMAPGNYIRKSTYLMSNPHVMTYGIFMKFVMTYNMFFRYGYHVAIAILLVIIGTVVYLKRHKLSRPFICQFVFYIILINLQIVSFIGVAYYSPVSGRMLMILDSTIFILFAISILEYLSHKKFSNPGFKQKIKYSFWGISLLFFGYITYSYYLLNQFINKRNYLINNALTNHQTDVHIPAYCINEIFKYPVYFDDMGSDSSNGKNLTLAKYYKVNRISVKGCAND